MSSVGQAMISVGLSRISARAAMISVGESQ